MIEDLLVICKDLLKTIEEGNFTQEDKEYIISVVRKVIFIILIELGKK